MNSDTPTLALIQECRRQEETCRYTAATFTIWLRLLRWIQTFCFVAPVVFGALATWKILVDGTPWVAAVFTLLATVIPPAYKASRLDEKIAQYAKLTGEFTNLRDRFRQMATVGSTHSFEEFEASASPFLNRLEKAREIALTPPEWCFKLARLKIKSGDYVHDCDGSSNA